MVTCLGSLDWEMLDREKQAVYFLYYCLKDFRISLLRKDNPGGWERNPFTVAQNHTCISWFLTNGRRVDSGSCMLRESNILKLGFSPK